MKVRFADPDTKLILIRVPRKDCGMVRAAICLVTDLSEVGMGGSGRRSNAKAKVVLSVISVNGSARTAKLVTMAYVRKYHNTRLKGLMMLQQEQQQGNTTMTNKNKKELQKRCTDLETVLTAIQNID